MDMLRLGLAISDLHSAGERRSHRFRPDPALQVGDGLFLNRQAYRIASVLVFEKA